MSPPGFGVDGAVAELGDVDVCVARRDERGTGKQRVDEVRRGRIILEPREPPDLRPAPRVAECCPDSGGARVVDDSERGAVAKLVEHRDYVAADLRRRL